jgi:NAD-specific glutamate dehydrogenase
VRHCVFCSGGHACCGAHYPEQRGQAERTEGAATGRKPVLQHGAVHVQAAKLRVTVRRDELQAAVKALQQAQVEGPSAQVPDKNRFLLCLMLPPPVRERRRDRFLRTAATVSA